ncbi:hypothetical protein Goarm_022487, partial [Gossypium armourianum]|nr:hypothetical protein [Gossypium armourianum]
DVKAYLLSRFTSKEHKRLDKWQKKYERNELNGYAASFDELILEYETQLIKGFKSEHEVLAWFKVEKLRGVHK